MKRIDPDKYGYWIAKYGEEYARANAEADRAEEMKKIKLSTLMLKFDGSQASREMNALSDPVYEQHIADMVDLRCKANIAKAKFEAIKVDFEAWRTLESTKRAEMKLT